MMLEGTNASSAIRWVRQDLDEALNLIRENLEAFAEDKEDKSPLKAVQEQLEVLNLTFKTMDQEGARILTDEMIAVGGHILHSHNIDLDESLSALTDAMIVLPSYLDRLQAGHEDLPILLLPTMNELRATYDEKLLSEGSLFAPVLDIMVPELTGNGSAMVAENEFPAFANRIRSQYQMALLGWLKEQSKPEMLRPLEAVCNKLHERLQRHELRRLWWIAAMTIAGFREGALDNDLPLRRLFARLDMTLKAMSEGGQAGPSEEAITALSRGLLFQAAQAQPGSKPIDSLRNRFKLEELIPDREALLRARGAVTGRDAELFKSIGDAIREEMGLIKDTLDMELRTGRVDREQRETSLASLRQLADTLNMLNLPVPANALQELLPALEEDDASDTIELDSPLLTLARKLIEVESLLETHIKLLGEPVEEVKTSGYIQLPAAEQRVILSHVLDECVTSLHDAQESMRNMLNGDSDQDFDGTLESICGALTLAGQPEVSALIQKMGRALHAGIQSKLAGASDEEARLIPLTDSVAALELYLSGCRDEQAESLRFLEVMHERLDGLPEASASGESLSKTDIHWPEQATSKPDIAATESASQAADSGKTLDPDLQDIFLDEFDSVTEQLEQQLPKWLESPENHKVLGELKRGFHTLKGSGRMVSASEIGDFAARIEGILDDVIESRLEADETTTTTIRLAVSSLGQLKARLLQQESLLDTDSVAALTTFSRQLARGDGPDPEALINALPAEFVAQALGLKVAADESSEAVESVARVDQPADHPPVADTEKELAQVMMVEIGQHVDILDQFASRTSQSSGAEVSKDLIRSAHTLAGTMAMSPLGQESALARGLEQYFEALHKHQQFAGPETGQLLQNCLHRFRQRLSILEDGNATSYPLDDEPLLGEIADLTNQVSRSEKAIAEELAQGKLELEHALEEPSEQGDVSVQDETQELKVEETSTDDIKVDDGGIIAIFLEEATEVLERCDTILNRWRDKLGDQKLVQNLQREIHTFKGGARMAGLEQLGDLSHSMETLLEQIAANRLQATIAAVQALEEGCDNLTLWVDQLHSGQMPEASTALERFEKKAKALALLPSGKEAARVEKPIEKGSKAPVVKAEKEAPLQKAKSDSSEDEAKLAAIEKAIEKASPALPRKTAEKPQAAKAATEVVRREFREVQDQPAAEVGEDKLGQSHIRVASALMDSMVNHAGEISIYRARLEQQLSTVRFNLKEVGQTIDRLKEQLRKMDMETEAQMLSRYQRASTKESSEFDPLELDRFSNMQQLSRALTESVSDLVNLQDMLEQSVRGAETLLVQQSRVSSDLQENLMQTRMTPFGSAAPRLRRVVRAAAAETGKKARLQLKMAGSSDQLDRNVLERITAPLEHMLRNAVVHGIEAPELRSKNKKPEEGEIIVTVEAEATEFVVCVEDDGAGVNVDAVRSRALERGMIDKNTEITEKQLINFILDSGFSTSQTVTGLAGRGVGMDVVSNEIKQIGGSMEIDSQKGQGTCFTLRIPFSLAVMQAIGVSVGNRAYLVPLNSVAGVSRLLPADYMKLRNSESPVYEFADEEYPVMELEPLLGEAPIPVDSDNVSLLMIRAGDYKAAFRVADLQGHQEIVIKPVGPQISSIPGILGATISAEGEVVLILDMGPVIRHGLTVAQQPDVVETQAPEDEPVTPLVMVVDDSITMRKVTSRVLENHSLEVMTAQDGIDAIENLHGRVPDLMLLDIEMPRMDGYELAEHVRGDPRLRHIPIVMITSRAGQKHRKKAREAGANAYLTKPYQEADLVAQVGEMLEMKLQQRRVD